MRPVFAGAAMASLFFACGELLSGTSSSPTEIDAAVDASTADAAPRHATIYVVGGVGPSKTEAALLVGRFVDGALTWTTAGGVDGGFARGSAFVHGEWLWTVGGHDALLTAARPRRTRIDAPATWEELAPLSPPRFDVATAVVDASVFVIGGESPIGTVAARQAVERGTLSKSGVTWSVAPTLPSPRRGSQGVAWEDEIVVFGGYETNNSATCRPEVQALAGAWRDAGTLAEARHRTSVTRDGDRVYVSGGVCGTVGTNVEIFERDVDGGYVGRIAGALREPRYGHATAVLFGRLYVFGGYANGSSVTSAVDSAPLDPDGRVGAWRPEIPLPLPLAEFGFAVVVDP